MAKVDVVNDKTIRISLGLEDAIRMIQAAEHDISTYAHDIVTIYEKMPFFDYTSFCFYAYDSARLFESMLDANPREYLSFSLDAPDSFFYALYGGAGALYSSARLALEKQESADIL